MTVFDFDGLHSDRIIKTNWGHMTLIDPWISKFDLSHCQFEADVFEML